MGNIIAGERYTGRFATTSFSTTQRSNIVATLIQMVATWFQHCNAVLRKKTRCCESSRVISPLARKRPTCTLFIAAKSNILSDVRSYTRGSGLFMTDKRLRCLTSPKTAHDSRKSFGIAHNNLAFYHSGQEMHLLPD